MTNTQTKSQAVRFFPIDGDPYTEWLTPAHICGWTPEWLKRTGIQRIEFKDWRGMDRTREAAD